MHEDTEAKRTKCLAQGHIPVSGRAVLGNRSTDSCFVPFILDHLIPWYSLACFEDDWQGPVTLELVSWEKGPVLCVRCEGRRVIVLMEWFLGGIDRSSLNSNNPFVSQQGLEGGYFLRQSCELLLSPVSSHELSEKIQGTHMSQCEHIKLWRVNKDGDYRLP